MILRSLCRPAEPVEMRLGVKSPIVWVTPVSLINIIMLKITEAKNRHTQDCSCKLQIRFMSYNNDSNKCVDLRQNGKHEENEIKTHKHFFIVFFIVF